MQIVCPGTQWNILVYFLRFGSINAKKILIGHVPNNKYSITCVHQRVFSQLKKCQALFLKRPAGGAWKRFGGTAFFQLRLFSCYDLWTYYQYLIFKNFTKYKKAICSNIDFIVAGSRCTSIMVGRYLCQNNFTNDLHKNNSADVTWMRPIHCRGPIAEQVYAKSE